MLVGEEGCGKALEFGEGLELTLLALLLDDSARSVPVTFISKIVALTVVLGKVGMAAPEMVAFVFKHPAEALELKANLFTLIRPKTPEGAWRGSTSSVWGLQVSTAEQRIVASSTVRHSYPLQSLIPFAWSATLPLTIDSYGTK